MAFDLAPVSDMDGSKPIFIYNTPWEDPHAKRLSTSLLALGDKLTLGVATPSHNRVDEQVTAAASPYADLPLILFDPQLQKIGARFRVVKDANGNETSALRKGVPDIGLGREHYFSRTALDRHPYFAGATRDETRRESWVGEALAHQVNLGATALLAPTEALDSAHSLESARLASSDINVARQLAGESTTLIGSLTFGFDWLKSRELLSVILAEIKTSPERLWQVRIRWPNMPTGLQVLQTAYLDGCATLAGQCRAAGKTLIFAETDLLGWTLVACGGGGFSTTTSPSRRYYMPSAGGGGGDVTPKRRVVASSILRSVERAAAEALGASPEKTPPVPLLFDERIDSPDFDQDRANYDHVSAAAFLAAEMAEGDPARTALDRISAGIERADECLTRASANYPSHLAPWKAMLERVSLD